MFTDGDIFTKAFTVQNVNKPKQLFIELIFVMSKYLKIKADGGGIEYIPGKGERVDEDVDDRTKKQIADEDLLDQNEEELNVFDFADIKSIEMTFIKYSKNGMSLPSQLS